MERETDLQTSNDSILDWPHVDAIYKGGTQNATGNLQMKVDDINALDLVINTRRHNMTSTVEVKFKRNDILISASMRCAKKLKDEAITQEKILRYLGFNDLQIQSLKYE